MSKGVGSSSAVRVAELAVRTRTVRPGGASWRPSYSWMSPNCIGLLRVGELRVDALDEERLLLRGR